MTRRQSSSKLLASQRARWALACAVVVSLSHLSGKIAADNGRVNPDALALKGFLDRAQDYVSLQHKLEGAVPASKPSKDPTDIDHRRKTLAAGIRKARTAARPGELFGSAGPILRAVVRRDARDRSRRDAYAAMLEVPKQDPPAVNADYPEKAPLATVPALLLTNLPRLPEGLEYRFMGRDLIVRDTKANLIVDFVHEAVPTIRK